MRKRGLATIGSFPASGDLRSPSAVASHVTHIRSGEVSEAGWELAAPQREEAELGRLAPQQATYSATAADFFDVVFITVALVAYGADRLHDETAVCTQSVRSARSHATFHVRELGCGASSSEVASGHTVRFSRVAADTGVLSEPLRLPPPRARSPRTLGLSTSGHCPTGPPILPNISIRGWTSRYA